MGSAQDKERLDTIRARHSEASTDWRAIDSARNGEQLTARLLPSQPSVALVTLTEECGYQDRNFLLHAHADEQWLFEILGKSFRRIRELERLLEQPRPDLAKECGRICEDAQFKQFMLQKHGIPSDDRERFATGVRKVLQIESRSELNTHPAAARRWEVLLGRYREWKDAA
ncbi:hypothetical protein [Neorhizobium sp. IRS_2294]|uniref:hypothetical protein n=1 Tax=unclassified Neorhizobium TaxID=2629175 RepID=UPI003D2E0047